VIERFATRSRRADKNLELFFDRFLTDVIG
jgi:hypothetical protein